MNPNIINGIKADESILSLVQEILVTHFNGFKVRFTSSLIHDVISEDEQKQIIEKTHERAHRNFKENKLQILEYSYFPHMSSKIKNLIKHCDICKTNKYDRHPNNINIQHQFRNTQDK